MFDIKGLIDALRRRAHDDEDAGPSATKLMAELPRDQTLLALTEIVKAVAELNRNAKVGLKERFRSVQSLDDKARPLMALLIGVYQGKATIEGIPPRQVLPSLIACWQELASAYKLCLKQHAQQPAARFASESELITLRAIAYYAEQARWAYLRHYEPELRIWRNLNHLFLIADSSDFSHKEIARYPEEAPCPIVNYYLLIVLFKLAEPERRRTEDLAFLNQILPRCVNLVRPEKIIRIREQNYAVNLDDTLPPVKLRRNMVGERYRYFDTEALATHFHSLSPHPLDSAALNPIDLALREKLLADLAVVYSRAGQTRSRRSERRTREAPASVALGLKQIAHALQSNATEAEWETWTLGDESSNGIGLHYRPGFDDHLEIGEVLLLRQDGHIGLTFVRRMVKHRDGQIQVGAEKIAPQAQLVILQANGQPNPAWALYCPESPHNSRMLLLDSDLYHRHNEYTLSAGQQKFRVKLGPAQERLPKYVFVTFQVLEKSNDPPAS
ncbi:hypothetical protein [Chitinimonas sp. BJB300]|uniref:hypothetical protein n=1 Tax=Chitinimonas sp. BJB300 TaxID=1559339 RepID=UPI000C0ECA22|nr:hypothetical protein [Chitinimonas sp. BJB300]PHV12586.1 hypothetical protein CSQ89_04730 [Chitinimonas sp. BJB300]TSJ89903.1 hypothetical protein FG002_006790 [Chitinimonas sp. BJB300]